MGAEALTREQLYRRFHDHHGPWDMVIIGGGATGVGIAVDAASRGYSTLLLEQSDFGKGTSSRSTKLIHGGVRYLQQGNLPLVMEALRERRRLLRNAPHLVRLLPFVVPAYRWWERPYYGAGLNLYSLLALERSHILSRRATLAILPGANPDGLRGGIAYSDGQFDDARLLIHLVLTAREHGAVALNYARVVETSKDAVRFQDVETGQQHTADARIVINAAGPFSDLVRRMADSKAAPILAPSQGIHIVLDRCFLPADAALMVPRTPDGRVMFAIPWLGHTLIGTTDTPVAKPLIEPHPLDSEIEFLLELSERYLAKKPGRADIRSVFAGIRPLVGAGGDGTAALSRDHTIRLEASGILTIAGGKWTTYRRMAEDCVDRAAAIARLPERPCATREMPIHRWTDHQDPIVRAVRDELALTVEDVLARRTRALFLDARTAMAQAAEVAKVMARELARGTEWQKQQVAEFEELARNYLPT